MLLKKNQVISISGDSKELGIEDYNVRVNTLATVLENQVDNYQDISFTIAFDASKLPCEQIQEIIDEVDSYYECFDIEEHVTLNIETKKNGVAGVPDVVTLVEDAKEIDKIFKKLSEFVNDLPKQDVIFRAVDIDYDIDEDDDIDECDLPDEVEIEPIEFDYAEDYCENNYEGVVDLVLDKTGWFIKSCRITQVINGDTTTEV